MTVSQSYRWYLSHFLLVKSKSLGQPRFQQRELLTDMHAKRQGPWLEGTSLVTAPQTSYLGATFEKQRSGRANAAAADFSRSSPKVTQHHFCCVLLNNQSDSAHSGKGTQISPFHGRRGKPLIPHTLLKTGRNRVGKSHRNSRTSYVSFLTKVKIYML